MNTFIGLSDLLVPALQLAVGFTLALLLVLLLRRPLRRWAGARSAYALWLLPPLALVAALLAQLLPAPAARGALASLPALAVTLHAAVPELTTRAASASWVQALLLLWLAGSALALLVLLGRYLALRLALRHDARDAATYAREVSALRIRRHGAGPALLWAPRPLLLLPPDFEQRFDAAQRREVLQHECCHHAHGDAWWNLLAALLAVLFWWHPLLPWVRRAYALDQELACDALLLARHGPAPRTYAQTLLHAARCELPLLASGVAHPRQLKERIAMLAQPVRSLPRRLAAVALLSVLAAGTALAAAQSAAPPPAQPARNPFTFPATQDIRYNADHPPRYPVEAVKKHEQGTVNLLVKVGTDGRVLEIRPAAGPQPAQSLVSASVQTVAQWRFRPGLRDGKPVAGWVKVPIVFSLSEEPPAPAGSAPGKA